jgi:hypothetical protein
VTNQEAIQLLESIRLVGSGVHAEAIDKAIGVLARQASNEPTLDECLAAINRNKHRHYAAWAVRVSCQLGDLNEVEIRAVGRHYIEQERRAKEGGEA